MKIAIAKTAGFCMGVRRAVEMVLDAPGKHRTPIFTYGPLIHNPQVLQLLEEKGITVLKEIPEKGSGTILIRAHGVPPEANIALERAGFTVIDATCPRVIRVQRIIAKHAGQGAEVIIIGDRDHPEVVGLLGYADGKGIVAGTMAELEALPRFDNAIIVAQTTQNTRFFGEVREWAQENFPHYRIFDTICDSTEKRQAEVKAMAESVDALVVVGGKNSGNTQRLAEIAKNVGIPAYPVETESELDLSALSGAKCIGITAGASTPNWIIRRIYRSLETISLGPKQNIRQRAVYRIKYFLLQTNLYVSLGAGALCYACIRLQKIEPALPFILIAMLYVLSMHIFNHLTGREEARYNDPDRALFYEKYKYPLAALALFAGMIGLLKAMEMGTLPFLILTIMSLLGLSYNLRVIPSAIGGKYRRIRDLPGSKTILIALAWGVVTALFPPLSVKGTIALTTFAVFFLATGMVFVRTAFFDILDMQGDRIVGKETIPILLGEKQTLQLLKGILIGAAAVFLLLGVTGGMVLLGIFLAICPLSLMALISAHAKGFMLPGMRLEFLVESHFVLAGLMTALWSLIIY